MAAFDVVQPPQLRALVHGSQPSQWPSGYPHFLLQVPVHAVFATAEFARTGLL